MLTTLSTNNPPDDTVGSSDGSCRGDVENPAASKKKSKAKLNDCADNNDLLDQSARGLATWERSVVLRGSRAVYVVLITAAIFLSMATYLFLVNARQKEFRSEFHSYAREIADIANNNARNSFDLLHTLATSLTSQAVEARLELHQGSFPNVTLPSFQYRAKELVHSTAGVQMVMFLPFVEENTKDGWEEYMNLNEDKSSDKFDRIFPCKDCEAIQNERPAFADNLLEGILEDHGYDVDGLSVPVSQYGPATNDEDLTMMNLFSHPIFKKQLVTSLEYDAPVLSEITNLDFLLKHVIAEGDGPDASKDSIRSFMATPVKDSFEENARTVGFVVAIVPWSVFFENSLSSDHQEHSTAEKEINGIVARVISDCGETFTYVLNGGKDDVAMAGDHEESYEGFKHVVDVSSFLWEDHHEEDLYTSQHCHFNLHIHPSREFYQNYEDITPIVYAGLVLSVFLFTAVLFYIYDSFIFERQRELVSQATSLLIENAQKAAQNERDLNDFIAHEVRNPLAAAITACSFVSTAIVDDTDSTDPLIQSNEKRQTAQEDIQIIDSSLHFINDLLRNMLDMQRAGSNQMTIETKPTQVLDDIFKPTINMLHYRGADFKVELVCPDNLIVMTDPLRLKQIMLNLSRNAVKFVEHGFIRLSAKVVLGPDGQNVELAVEDSGPGIPEEKSKELFGKFQESLDSLNQGTGIGLNLCKQLTELMGAYLYIDKTYFSGLVGSPGTRFVIDLNQSPIQLDDEKLSELSEGIHEPVSRRNSGMLGGGSQPWSVSSMSEDAGVSGTGTVPKVEKEDESASEEVRLPEVLNVLFVDDDMVLRKLFARSVKKTVPKWNVKEAANGETALQIAKEHQFDLIFIDQYMASATKQLLGTETARALRAQGVSATLCGLSANDVERAFLDAGADGFMFKPFPCKPDLLKVELLRIIRAGKSAGRSPPE